MLSHLPRAIILQQFDFHHKAEDSENVQVSFVMSVMKVKVTTAGNQLKLS